MDRAAIEDLFAPVARVVVRRMFGGQGVFDEGRMVALEAGGVLYLKVDPTSEAVFAEAGCEPFSYGSAKRRIVMSYRRLPEAAFEDPDELRRWYEMARRAASRLAGTKRPPRKRAAAKNPD